MVCDEKIFEMIKDCATFYNIPRRKLNGWLLNFDKMPQEFKDMGLAYYTEN